MYIASFRTPEEAILQGLVVLPGLPRLPADVRQRWWNNHAELLQGICALGGAAASLRVTFNPGMSLHRVLFCCLSQSGSSQSRASQSRSMELRRFLAPFTRLEALVSGSATFPVTRQDYDAVADDVPLVRCRAATPGFRAGSARLACDFRINSSLGSLLAQADSYGYRISYQVNIRFVNIDREQVRAARKNALEVRRLAGVSQALVAMQERLADQLLTARAVCEEYLAVDAGPAVRWLRDTLRHDFHQQFARLGFEPGSWDFVEGGYEEELACPAFPTADDFFIDELCAGAVPDNQVTTLLGWRPADSFADRFGDPGQADMPEARETAALPVNLPAAYPGDEPFIFVSYKRSDLDRVCPVMRYLQERGYRIWYDHGIRGGDDWNAILEERLTSCRSLVLFLSQAAIDSKYVRREVLFADSMDKRIISVCLEAAQLRHGMGLLLPRYQIIEHRASDFPEQLVSALNHL
ncbi:MAG TPA: toll/interleukin-1 receptor domain-containing protein [Pseudonocardiaceae bacterium]|nr:toll/interleukin-1 receptor domain-containing protein [Pseudonocardiaceae bacterium]